MSFTSFDFLVFLPAVVLLYNLIPKSWRLYYLLLVSYGFYAYMQPIYAVLLFGVSAITYGFARWIASADNDRKQLHLMRIGIVLVLLPLVFFKYLPWNHWILPVGISFYTFMAIGYLVDVYQETVPVEKNPCRVGLFLSFFPYILSGPIERAGNMFPQMQTFNNSTPRDLTAGGKMMLWGYFMKLCVADRLAIYTSFIMANYMHHNGVTLAVTALLCPIQLYADFGGYSLIAMGVARCLGFDIIPNFRRPFFATSIKELWHRWHIALSSWLRDYLYFPLGGSRVKFGRHLLNLMIVFLVCGLWHGADWTFIVWGLIQGVLVCIDSIWKKKHSPLLIYVVFAFGLIYFAYPSFSQVNEVFVRIFTQPGRLFLKSNSLALLSILGITILLLKDIRDEYFPTKFLLYDSPHTIVRLISYIITLALILCVGVLDTEQFIYFQF